MGLDFRVAMGRAYRPSVLLAFGLVTTSPDMTLVHGSGPVAIGTPVESDLADVKLDRLERAGAKIDEADPSERTAVREVALLDAQTLQASEIVEPPPPPLEGGSVAPPPTPVEAPASALVEAPGPAPATTQPAPAAVEAPAPAPPAQKVSRPVSNSGSGNGFYYGYCTWWVANKRPIPWRGNAWEWWANARQFGFQEGQEPQVGAIMVLGISPSSPLGHVAYVESVNDDGSFTVSEMNWGRWGVVSFRTIKSRQGILGFIY